MTTALQELAAAIEAILVERQDLRSAAERALGELVVDACAGRPAAPALTALGVADYLVAAAASELADLSPASPNSVELEAVLREIARLGPPHEWPVPPSYESLALAAIDSIWSIGVRYTGVLNVIHRYVRHREAQGADAHRDGATELANTIDACGGPRGFAERVANRQRTSSQGGVLKAEAVHHAAVLLMQRGIETGNDLRRLAPSELAAVEAGWRSIPGQGSGLSWSYFLMLNRFPGVKADRMIRRFVAGALGLEDELAVSPDRASGLLLEAAGILGVESRALDYAVWSRESAGATSVTTTRETGGW